MRGDQRPRLLCRLVFLLWRRQIERRSILWVTPQIRWDDSVPTAERKPLEKQDYELPANRDTMSGSPEFFGREAAVAGIRFVSRHPDFRAVAPLSRVAGTNEGAPSLLEVRQQPGVLHRSIGL